MESGDIVRALNKSQQAITLRHGSRDYVMHPFKETAIPFDCMVLYFGDPRATKVIRSVKDSFGIVTWIPDRESEVRRLRVKWGVVKGDARQVFTSDSETQLPDVQFMDFDGNTIITVVKDPFGEHVETATQTVSEVELLREQVIRQGAMIDQLVASSRPTPVDDEITASGLETDGPEVAPPATPFEQQAVEAFAASDAPPGTLADIPEDDGSPNYRTSEALRATPVTDLTGNNVHLSDEAAELARLRDEAIAAEGK